jgi:hypothetical protein
MPLLRSGHCRLFPDEANNSREPHLSRMQEGIFYRKRHAETELNRSLQNLYASSDFPTIISEATKVKIMKQGMRSLIARAIAFGAILMLSSCTKTSEAASARANAASAPGGSDSLGKATFSVVVDGAMVSGGEIDGLQQRNTAYLVPDDAGGAPKLRFWLFDAKTPNELHVQHVFRFEVPNKIAANSPTLVKANIVQSTGTTAQYSCKQASVTITSLNATRVAGTFSGKCSVPPNTPQVPKTVIDMTDGKFDIPMATMKAYPN